jgi:hypothetical protein
MRSFDYARTLPEAREGLPVFVVGFAFVIMAPELLWTVWIDVNDFPADWRSGEND